MNKRTIEYYSKKHPYISSYNVPFEGCGFIEFFIRNNENFCLVTIKDELPKRFVNKILADAHTKIGKNK